jgi:protein gp37
VPEALEKPLRKPRRVLVPSMGDLFADGVPWAYLAGVVGSMALSERATFLVLTKRIERAARFVSGYDALPNVLIGCTVENQRRADERLPVLAEIAAMGWRTWASMEPLLGRIGWAYRRDSEPEFVAVGAETGPGARPCDDEWILSVVQQCAEANVRCHVKQLDSRGGAPGDGWPRELVEAR